MGREVTDAALARGHSVTCLARGEAGRFAEGCRTVIADRGRLGAYDAVVDESWDAVIDVARQPGQVRRAVSALQPVASRFLFVSSGNVYAGQRELGQDEDAALLSPLDSDVMGSMEHYGEAKVACERAVLNEFRARESLGGQSRPDRRARRTRSAGRATGRTASPTRPTPTVQSSCPTTRRSRPR